MGDKLTEIFIDMCNTHPFLVFCISMFFILYFIDGMFYMLSRKGYVDALVEYTKMDPEKILRLSSIYADKCALPWHPPIKKFVHFIIRKIKRRRKFT